MKYLLLLAVIAVVLWMVNARKRPPPPKSAPKAGRGAQAMIACAHCGVHLPQSETVADAAGRAFCSEAHRIAGPR